MSAQGKDRDSCSGSVGYLSCADTNELCAVFCFTLQVVVVVGTVALDAVDGFIAASVCLGWVLGNAMRKDSIRTKKQLFQWKSER